MIVNGGQVLNSQGLVLESLKMLDQVLEAGPGNVKAQKLQAEIRAEVANQHVAEGRRLYEARLYDKAIGEWKAATEYGYDPKASDQLVARAKEQIRRDCAFFYETFLPPLELPKAAGKSA